MIKLIKDYPSYAISDDGRVYSLRRHLWLTPKNNHDGYLRIQLWNHQQCRFVGIHRLVAEAFLENPKGCKVVNHKNGIKSDNRVENLEWVTQQDNIRHAWDTGLSKPHATNNVKVIHVIGDIVTEYNSISEGSRATGIPRHWIYNSLRNPNSMSDYWKKVI